MLQSLQGPHAPGAAPMHKSVSAKLLLLLAPRGQSDSTHAEEEQCPELGNIGRQRRHNPVQPRGVLAVLRQLEPGLNGSAAVF